MGHGFVTEIFLDEISQQIDGVAMGLQERRELFMPVRVVGKVLCRRKHAALPGTGMEVAGAEEQEGFTGHQEVSQKKYASHFHLADDVINR